MEQSRAAGRAVTTVYIGMGGNVGDVHAAFVRAQALLGAVDGVCVLRVSGPVRTAAEVWPGSLPQPEYSNIAAALETTLAPRDLLGAMLRVEQELGRDRANGVRWAPRTIDLDLLLYGDEVIDTEGLRVPHPRMAQRRFVLEPLAQIAPNAVHPVLGKTAVALLRALGAPA